MLILCTRGEVRLAAGRGDSARAARRAVIALHD